MLSSLVLKSSCERKIRQIKSRHDIQVPTPTHFKEQKWGKSVKCNVAQQPHMGGIHSKAAQQLSKEKERCITTIKGLLLRNCFQKTPFLLPFLLQRKAQSIYWVRGSKEWWWTFFRCSRHGVCHTKLIQNLLEAYHQGSKKG